MNAPLRSVAASQHGAFTSGQALVAGYDPSARRRAVCSGRWVRLFRGVYTDAAGLITVQVRARAALLVLPGPSVISHQTVLELAGLPIAKSTGQPVIHVTLPHGIDAAPRPGMIIHRCDLPERDVVGLAGIRQTTAARAVLDAARVQPLVEGVVLADAALQQRLCNVEELDFCLTGLFGLPGILRAREVRRLADGRAESPMETRLRLLLLDGGLPPPEPQFNVFDDFGFWVARVDFAYASAMLAIEFDGREAHDTAATFVRDRERQNALIGAGWTVLRYVGRDVYQRAPLIISQVRAALGRAEQAA